MEISEPWFTVWLVPIHQPMSDDVWGSRSKCAPVRTPDGDTLDLNRQVHTRIDGGPAWRHVPQYTPIIPLPVRMALWGMPNDLPECAHRNAFFLSLLPQLPLTPHLPSLEFQFPSLVCGTKGSGFEIDERCQSVGAADKQHGLNDHNRQTDERSATDDRDNRTFLSVVVYFWRTLYNETLDGSGSRSWGPVRIRRRVVVWPISVSAVVGRERAVRSRLRPRPQVRGMRAMSRIDCQPKTGEAERQGTYYGYRDAIWRWNWRATESRGAFGEPF